MIISKSQKFFLRSKVGSRQIRKTSASDVGVAMLQRLPIVLGMAKRNEKMENSRKKRERIGEAVEREKEVEEESRG